MPVAYWVRTYSFEGRPVFLCPELYGANNWRLLKFTSEEATVIVQVYDNNVEKALRVFKRNCQKSGLTKDIRRKRFYEKPSDRRKRKLNAALRRKR